MVHAVHFVMYHMHVYACFWVVISMCQISQFTLACNFLNSQPEVDLRSPNSAYYPHIYKLPVTPDMICVCSLDTYHVRCDRKFVDMLTLVGHVLPQHCMTICNDSFHMYHTAPSLHHAIRTSACCEVEPRCTDTMFRLLSLYLLGHCLEI